MQAPVGDEDPPRAIRIAFRPVPGLRAEHLERVIECHIARNASLGHDVPEMDYCPLVPHGVEAEVEKTGTGLMVTVSGKDGSVRAEVFARARRLMAR